MNCKHIRQIALALVCSSGLGWVGAAGAISVFADVDGDMAADTSVRVNPNASLSLDVYASQSNAEVGANGGLDSFDLIVQARDGLALSGNNAAEKAAGVSIDSLWDGFPSAASLGGESVQVGGNVIVNSPSTNAIIHLFVLGLVAPGTNGTYDLMLSDAPGPSFGAGFAVYDAGVQFQSLQVQVVPLPAAWALGLGGFGALAAWRRRRRP